MDAPSSCRRARRCSTPSTTSGIAAAAALQGSRSAPLGACRTCLVPRRGSARRAGRLSPARARRHGRQTPSIPRPCACGAAVLDLTLSMLTPVGGRATASASSAAAGAPAWHAAPRAQRRSCIASRPTRRKSFFVLDREACILCGRCTIACDDVQQIGAISARRPRPRRCGSASPATARWRPPSARRAASAWPPARPARCARRKRPAPIVARRSRRRARYCGVGCGITLAGATDGRLAVMADDAPANRSSLRHALREGPLRHRLRALARSRHRRR